MKSPTAESSFNLIRAVEALLQCAELQRGEVSEATHQLIDGVLEATAQVKRECKFPERRAIIDYFAKRFAKEDREILVKRIVALVSTLSNEEMYSGYEEAQEGDNESDQGGDVTVHSPDA
jgi:hypothetical protein